MQEDNNIKEKKELSKKNINKENNLSVEDKIEFSDLDGKFLHISVGDEKSPADQDMITEIEEKILELLEKNNISCVAFVTHHMVDIKIIR